MRKYSPMFVMAVWLVLALFTCALMMASINPIHRVFLLVTAAAVGCVFMLCQSRVERAHAPLILRDECVAKKNKPPDGGNK